MGRRRRKAVTLSGFLVVATTGVTVVMLLFLYLASSKAMSHVALAQARTASRGIEEATLTCMTEMMRKGATRQEFQSLLESLHRPSGSGITYSIHVRKPLRQGSTGGPSTSPPPEPEDLGPLEEQAVRTGRPAFVVAGEALASARPLTVKAECQGCHRGVRTGEVLGVVRIDHDLRPSLVAGRRHVSWLLLAICPVPVAAAFFTARALGRRVQRSVRHLEEYFARASMEEGRATTGPREEVDLGFLEFNALFDSLVERLEAATATLRLHIHTLRSLTVSGEAARDFRDEVRRLVLNLEGVLPIRAMCLCTRGEDGTTTTEVFWPRTPDAPTRRRMEEEVRSALLGRGLAGTAGNQPRVDIAHTVVRKDGNLPPAPEGPGEEGTRWLVPSQTAAGGVLGVGIAHGRSPNGASAGAVVEGVLPVLLNLLGSVRAIEAYARQLEYHATRDSLTGLYNHKMFWELLVYETCRAGRHGYPFSVLMLDMDSFKLVNDLHGHSFGDRYLQEVARTLRGSLRKEDIVARCGGDEFAAILPGADAEQAMMLATRLRESLGGLTLAAPDGSVVRATASLGLAVYPHHAATPADLFSVADAMMYRAKAEGRDRVAVAAPEDVAELGNVHGEKAAIVHAAVSQHLVVPYFQPILNLRTGKVEAHEVLMRIQLPGRVMAAAEFVETAENSGLLPQMDLALMDKAFGQARRDGYEGILFLNLSPKSLARSEFAAAVRQMAANHSVDPARIVFELTERETIRNLTLFERLIRAMKADGFRFAIDDFGSGYSSFRYLRSFPVDFIKIDGEFVRGMGGNDATDRAIVSSLVALARGLGILTIGECVESEDHLAHVRTAGIGYAQGYGVGRPSPFLVRA